MTKAKSRHGKLKGAVLLMVLAVMTVLIIMLAGAMAIVSTAGNRAITKYEESQAYYTARSGIEVITQTLMGDSVHVDKGNNNDGNNHKSQNTFSSTSKSQALAFEEAITGVNKTDPSDSSKIIYDVSKSLTAWDSIHNPTGAGLTDTQKKNSYMIFNVADMSNFGGDDGSGMFSDSGDDSVQVKVQLLQLEFDNGSGTPVERNSIVSGKVDVTNGDANTYYISKLSVLIECTANYNGVSSTVSKVVSPIEKSKNTSTGFNSTGALNMSTNSSVFGGAVSATSFSWGNDGITAGSVYVNQNSSLNAQKVFVLEPSESMVINGDFRAENNMVISPSGSSASEKPFVFVNGTFSVSSQPPLIGYNKGSDWGISNASPASSKVDLITQNFKGSNSGLCFVNGNAYIDGYLQIDFGGTNFESTNKPFFGGDLFISDKSFNASKDYVEVSDLTGSWQIHKSNFGIVNYSKYPSNDPDPNNRYRIKFTINTGSKLWNEIINNGGDQFCSGNIYYYYYEENDRSTTSPTLSSNSKYYGCMELEAIRQYILYIKDSAHTAEYNTVYAPNMSNIDKFLSKLHPVGPYIESNSNFAFTALSNPTASDIYTANNMKYIIQLASNTSGMPDFVDKFKFKPVSTGGVISNFNIEIEDDPSYLLKVTLPKVNGTGSLTNRMSDPDIRELPTLFSKYASYFFINNTNPLKNAKWVLSADANVFLNATGTAEKKDFTYKDSLNGGVQKSTSDWKSEVGTIATDFTNINNPSYIGSITHNNLVTRAWDILNALYEVDSAGNMLPTRNVCFLPSALQAYLDNNIIFTNIPGTTDMNFSTVANIDVAANLPKTYQTLSPSTASSNTTVIDTSATDVIVMLSPGSYHDGKLLVSGTNYAYIMMPYTGDGRYQFWNYSIVTEDYDTNILSANPSPSDVKVGNGGSATAAVIKAPNIIIYADDNTTFDFYNNSGQYSFMGYIYGPGSKIQSNDASGFKKNLYYQGAYTANVHMDILGSAFVGDIDVKNGFSFIYIPPVETKDPWEPKFNWSASGIGYTNQGIKEVN